jgi:hypothetical protein
MREGREKWEKIEKKKLTWHLYIYIYVVLYIRVNLSFYIILNFKFINNAKCNFLKYKSNTKKNQIIWTGCNFSKLF